MPGTYRDPKALLPSVACLNPQPHQRISLPPADADERGIYGPLTNGQRVALHLAPAIRAGLQALAQALIWRGRLDAPTRQMVIVRVGYLSGCAYEVHQHRSLAKRVGVPEATLDALAYVDPPELTDRQHAVICFVDQLVADVRPDDRALAAVRRHLSDGEVLEVVMVAGNWMMLARMLETAGVPMDATTIAEQMAVP